MFGYKHGIISRLFDNLDAARAELVAERAARLYAEARLREEKVEHAKTAEEYRRRLAVNQANFEWLSIAFNKSEAERSQLMLGRLGIVTPAMTVQVGATDPVPLGQPVDAAPRRSDADSELLRELLSNAGPFDDVGETAARALGMNAGEVYDPGSLLLKG